jgi:hypothetical protein
MLLLTSLIAASSYKAVTLTSNQQRRVAVTKK